jgi:type II secretory pathway pseudopilin PulG
MRRRATTLVELMIALLVLSVCAGALLAGVGQAGSRAGLASDKVLILNAVKNQMDIARQAGRNGNLVTTTFNSNVPVPGLPYLVNFSRTATPVMGEPNLFAVRVVATWAGVDNKRTGTMQLDTLVYNEP